jgi:hypothetical protein
VIPFCSGLCDPKCDPNSRHVIWNPRPALF